MWVIYSILSSLALSVRNNTGKLGVDSLNPYIVAWSTVVFSFPLALISVILFGFSITDSSFWILLPIRIIMDVIALISLLTAFKFKSVSFVIPLLSLTPILTFIVNLVFRNEGVGTNGIIGILVIALSCLLIYFSEYKATKIEERKDLFKATALVGLTGLLFSLLDPLHPRLIERSTPYTYFFVSTLCFIAVFTLIAYIKSRDSFKVLFSNKKLLILNIVIGLMLGFEVLTLFLAFTEAPAVALVSSLRTTNIAITSIIAFFIFKEKFNTIKILGICGSIIGAIIMLV